MFFKRALKAVLLVLQGLAELSVGLLGKRAFRASLSTAGLFWMTTARERRLRREVQVTHPLLPESGVLPQQLDK